MADLTITIAGRLWPVPLLAPRQNRIVVPALIELDARPEGHYDRLLDIVFVALTRAHPAITRADFEDWPIAYDELINALPIIARQTGFVGERAGPARPARHILPDWDAIIARFVNFLPGTTPDYWEDALTVPRLEAMQNEWREHPPVSQLVAAFLGYRPKPRDEEALAELMRLFPGGQLRLN